MIDGAIMALLVDLRRALVARGTSCEIVNAPPRTALLVHLYRGDQPPEPIAVPVRRASPIAWLGGFAVRVVDHLRALVVLAAQLIGALVSDVRRIDWRAVPALIERAGTDGIVIVVVADFLMGFTMAYQSMTQLRQYGANIYVADIVGISVTRELSPLMTAVLVVGRSGAAYAAELGAMRVSEEIDALRMMGVSPVSHLVAPRMVTLAIAAPVLTLFGDVAGIVGGIVVGVTSLGVSPHAYIAELRTVVVASDVWTGLVKGASFGVAIAFIGCLHGLAASGAASGVGRSTTATVVASTFAIIAIDTVLTVVFRGLGA
jgi:phospholipid/cholesterol/gamma-HCH transport system permease protein